MNAILSADGRYRYHLSREWGGGQTMTFVMLNPSTADAETDDPTIRRCIGFAKREGCGRLAVVNLFSYRTPYPKALVEAHNAGVDICGPDHDHYMQRALNEADGPIVAAWGAHPLALHGMARQNAQPPRPLVCLGKTKAGAPRHPLYLASDSPLVPLVDAS